MSLSAPLRSGKEGNSSDLQVNHQSPSTSPTGSIYLVRFLCSSETVACSTEEEDLHVGQTVLATSRYGKDLARVLGPVSVSAARDMGSIMPIVRVADERDLNEYEKNLPLEVKALSTCRSKVESHGLQMKVLSAHILSEENKLLFFFAAEGRVDFRELVRDLVSSFRMRIELRQIGVRDETRLLGGVGLCGRVLCCYSFPNQMCSVSIKMAKEQDLSLGSTKVSGPCGRLMCCLSYEHAYYCSERPKFPRPGTPVTAPPTSYTVVEVNMISRNVVLAAQGGGVVSVALDCLRYDRNENRWVAELPPEASDA